MSSFLINPFVSASSASSLPAGLALWLSPWQETVFANNDPVGDTGLELHDWSGNGRHFSQSSSGSRPLYKTATLNGQPSVLLDRKSVV